MHMITSLLFTAAVALAAPATNIKRADNTAVNIKLPIVVKANTRNADQSLIQSLMLAPSARQRQNLLNQPGDTIFNFMDPPKGSVAEGKGGRVVSANAATFPALIGGGGALSVAFLGPCGLNSPHTHPRGQELNIPVQGQLVTSFITENGVAAREDLLETFSMAVFPQGAVHAEYNPGCEPAVFVAAFDNADPGVEQIAQAFFGLRTDISSASLNGVTALNGQDIATFASILPENVVVGVESCLAKCGLQKREKRDIAEVLAESA